MSPPNQFTNKSPMHRRKKELTAITIVGVIFLSSIYYFSYIKNLPSNPSDFPTINVVSTGEIKKDDYVNCTFELNSEDESDNILPINSKIKMAQNIYKDFTDSIKGLRALKTTYGDDTMFCCKLQTLIEHIETKTIDFHKKYTTESSDSPGFEDCSE